jgi:phospholipid transport system substrate-binding protein
MRKTKYLIINIIALIYITILINAKAYANTNVDNKPLVITNNLNVPPSVVAKTITEHLIELFKENITSYRKNETIMYDQVKDILSDIIAFDQISVSIMGKHAKKATKNQIAKFSNLLKDNLVEFYSKVFLEFEADKFVITHVNAVPQREIDEYKQGKRRLISVKLTIAKNNENYTIKYSLIQSNNKWKLKNITFDKTNVGVQLRNRFSEIYDKQKNIDKSIDSWVNNTKL